MAGSFVENVNLLASKVGAIEEANVIFDEGVIPILQEIATLDLAEAINDLKKGNYLGNRKVDINLALNMQGITNDLINKDPTAAEAIWNDATKTVLYDKAIATYVDGTVIELPFIFDGYPTTISTHGELLAQFTRLDYVYAQAQVDSIYQVTVGNTTDYVITIDSVPFTYKSGVGATRESIIAGLANMVNAAAVPITAKVTDTGTKLSMTADVAGNPFFATVSSNMAIDTIVDNIIEGPRETAFLNKLVNTLAANFASPVVGEIVRFYDVIGSTSNLERLQLHAVSGNYVTATPVYYWANTTSAFQTLSMRANDIIKLGNEIDNIIALSNNIQEVIEVQNRLPQLIDTYDANGNPNGDMTIYNNLTELVAVYDKLIEIVTVYNDIKLGGTNYTNTVANNLTGSNTVGTVAADLSLGINSNVRATGTNIASVITVAHDINNVNSVAGNSANINSVATTVVPNIAEILQADNNAAIATTKAAEATVAANTATTKSNEIKNVSVGSTVTGVAGTPASVVYNPATGKFTFVVPQGIKGDRGEAFQVNAVGLLASKSLYDTAATGFSYLATDENKIYFKLSATSGDWSIGAPFGKGDTGATGATGTSIVSTTFTSTTDVSGLAGQSGATDTYTILYSDLGTDEFVVKNGLDGLSTVIDTLESVVGANAASYTVTIDTTSGVFEVYLNGLLLPTANYTLTGTTIVINTAVVMSDEVVVKKIYAVDVLDSYSQSAIDTKLNNLETKVRTNMEGLGLDLTNVTVPEIGQFAWNQDAQTYDFRLNADVTLQGGQETVKLVRNNTASNILNGTVVMATGSIGNSGRVTIAPCTGLFNAAYSVYGIATQDIFAGEDGFITTDGFVRGINTTGSTVGETWLDGDVLYVKPNNSGKLTKVVPADTELKVSVAKVVKAHASGTLEVRIASVLNENAYVPRVVSTDHRLAKFDGTFGKIQDSNLVSNASGNLGLNVSPSLWHTSVRALETAAGALFNYLGTKLNLVQNAYQGIDGVFRYKSAAPATMITQENGEVIIRTAPSGAAEASVTFTERMKVSNTGVLTVNGVSVVKSDGLKTINGSSVVGSGNIVTPTTTINNTLTSTSTTEALSANQGKELKTIVDTKQATLVSGTSIRTINGATLLGAGDLSTIQTTITGNAGTATTLQTARTINGVSFNGSANITVSDTTAVKLTGNETIAGVKTFSSNIVGNITGSITGNAETATKLTTPRQINGVNFDGSANITVVDSTKLPLAGGTMTGAITAIRETKVAMAANNIDLATGNLFTKTISGATTLTISNALASGNVNSFVLELTNAGSATITWFSGVKWVGGTAPTLTTSGKDILGFYSHDGGTTWNVLGVNKDVK